MRLYTDSATGVLASDIAIDTTVFSLGAGQGVNFPTPANYPDEFALLTLENTAGYKEKVILTERQGDQLTVIRAQEGTSAFAFLAGSRCELRMTATAIQNMLQKETGDVIDTQAGLGMRIYLKRYTTAGDGPAAGDLYEGEFAVNLATKWIWAGGIGSTSQNTIDPVVLSNGPNGALTLVTQAAHNFKVGQPLYWNGVSLELARANDIETCGRYVVKQVLDANTFLTATNGNVFPVMAADVGLTSITAGQVYYVSDDVAGEYEEAAIDIDLVNWRNPLVIGVTSNTLLVSTSEPYQIPTHNELRNRADNDCHPTSAISGLDTALAAKYDKAGGEITGPVTVTLATDTSFRISGGFDPVEMSTRVPSGQNQVWAMRYQGYDTSQGGLRMQLDGPYTASEYTWKFNSREVLSLSGNDFILGNTAGPLGLLANTLVGDVIIKANKSGAEAICSFINSSDQIALTVNADGTTGGLSARSAKTNIQAAPPMLVGLNDLKVRTFNMKDDPTGPRRFGLIADEVVDYFPDLVKTITKSDGEEQETVVYSQLAPMLLQAVQELAAEVKELRAKVR